jgi:C1A family cysteine protease
MALALALSPGGRRYGWIRNPNPPAYDPQTHFQTPPVHAMAQPPQVDLRPRFTSIPVYDQGNLGSCTANAWAGEVAYLRFHAKLPNLWTPSRLFIYWNERNIEGDVTQDAGAMLVTGATVLKNFGVPPEAEWPYDPAQFANQPPPQAFHDAHPHRIIQPQLINNSDLIAMRSCLALGWPIVMGFSVYESFESPAVASTGVVPMPAPGEKLLGGHAVLIVGYTNADQRFIVRNSYGPAWGIGGNFTIPYAYVTSYTLCSDCHTAHGCT